MKSYSSVAYCHLDCYFVSTFLKSSFYTFLENLELIIQNLKDKRPHCIILTGDFNCRSDSWWVEDEVTTGGTKLSEPCDSYCLNQLIEEPTTHISGNSLFCIDLIITDQPNLFVDSGVHSSLYAKSHHQIVFGVVSLSVPRPPPYKRTVWEYDKANIDLINYDLSSINWYEMFDGLDINQAVDLFTTLFLSVIARHVPNREINIDYKTNVRKFSVSINEAKIISIIRKLSPNKAHGCDNISIRMLKICDTVIARPLKISHEKCIETDRFPLLWKKANIVPADKKNSHQIMKNYRSISLLPICGKIFLKIIFDEIYEHLTVNKLLYDKQLGFRPGDSTINQLLSITHDIYNAFEHHHDKHAVLLDISKAFNKVWHEGLLLKLKSNGISSHLLNLFSNLLDERYQRTVLNGKSSDRKQITARVPQGSVLGPLLFLIYINDLADNIMSNVKLFAGDTSVFNVVFDTDISLKY